MNVRGVGEKSFLKPKPLVTVTAAKAKRAGSRSVRVRSRVLPKRPRPPVDGCAGCR
jgi:hypothetical protein